MEKEYRVIRVFESSEDEIYFQIQERRRCMFIKYWENVGWEYEDLENALLSIKKRKMDGTIAKDKN